MIKIQNFCPICLKESCNYFFLASNNTYKDTNKVNLKVNICTNCASYFLQEYIIEEEIKYYYPQNYYTKTKIDDTGSFKSKIRQISTEIFKGYPKKLYPDLKLFLASVIYRIYRWHRFDRIPNYLKNIKNPALLEIGYGNGNYLIDLKKIGWDCYGIDTDQSNKDELQKKGIIVSDKFENIKFKKNKVDFIYSYHAFEHIYNIDIMMENCHRLLSQDGVFKFCVPINDGFLPKIFKKYWYDLGVPIHKQIFSLKGVKIFVERHGFKISKYKHNSLSESFLGSIVASIIGLLKYKKISAQEISENKIFKFICFFISPIVLILDILNLGDRVEFTLKKQKK